MEEKKPLNLTLIVEVRKNNEVVSHQEVNANEQILELKHEGPTLLTASIEKITHKAVKETFDKLKK